MALGGYGADGRFIPARSRRRPVDTQPCLFDPPPRSKTTDPVTSHEAENFIRESGRLGEMQQQALELVMEHPGWTAHEYDREIGGEDHVKIARRLSELEAARLIHSEGTKKDALTGRRCLRWYPGRAA